MGRYRLVLAPRAVRDVETHARRLSGLEAEGAVASGYAKIWFSLFEETIAGLGVLAERHPFAPERGAWRRDVRNALFAHYRILYLLIGEEVVWVVRVRHQRQGQLERPGPGTAPPRDL